MHKFNLAHKAYEPSRKSEKQTKWRMHTRMNGFKNKFGQFCSNFLPRMISCTNLKIKFVTGNRPKKNIFQPKYGLKWNTCSRNEALGM